MGKFFDALLQLFDVPPTDSEKADLIQFIIPLVVFYLSKVIAGIALLLLRNTISIWYKLTVALIVVSSICDFFVLNNRYWAKRYLVCLTAAHLLMVIILMWKSHKHNESLNRSRYDKKDFGDDDMESLLGEETTTAPTTWRSGYDLERDDGSTTCTPRRSPRQHFMGYTLGMSTFPSGNEVHTKRKKFQPIDREASEKIRRKLFSPTLKPMSPESASNSSDVARSSEENLNNDKHASTAVSITDNDDGFYPLPADSPTEPGRGVDFKSARLNLFGDDEDHLVIKIPCDLLDLDNLPKQWQAQEMESDVTDLPEDADLEATTTPFTEEMESDATDLLEDATTPMVTEENELQPKDALAVDPEIGNMNEEVMKMNLGDDGSDKATRFDGDSTIIHIPCELLELDNLPIQWLEWEKVNKRDNDK